MQSTFKRQKVINIALCFVMVFVGLGFCSANKSLYLAAICEALDVKRTVFSLSTSCRYVTTSVVNIFFGALVLKYGTKKLIGIGFGFLTLSMLLNSLAQGVGLFYLSEVCSGIGFSLTSTTMVGSVVNRWSPENKGTIMGAVLCANGIGGAISSQIVSPMIYNPNNIFGYRDAYRLVAVLLVVTLAAFLIFFREKPKGEQLAAAPAAKKKARGQSWDGIAFAEAVKKPCFYAALVCIFFTGFCLQGIGSISSAHMKDVGLTPEFVAAMSSLSLLALTGSKFLSGLMYDKIGLRRTITVSCVAAVLCMLSLSAVSVSGAGKGLAIAYAVLSSVALPLETVMLPLYAGDLFGDHSFDQIMGIFVSVNVAGYAVGTPLVNLGFDLTGSYRSVLLLTAAIMLVVTVCMQFVITAAHKLRPVSGETEAIGG